jgi:SPP1 family predicted phage head-tail adaptor
MNFTASGRLNHELTIEAITGQTQGANGETTSVWTPQETIFAEIKPLTGRNVEIALAKTKGRTVTHHITMRWVDGLNPATTRFDFHGRKLEIFVIDNVLERNIEAQILVNEIVS